MTRTALIAALAVAVPSSAGPYDPWKVWFPLVGTWEADKAADGTTGGFTLEYALGGKALLRNNHSDKGDQHHEDLMIVFIENGKTRAEYWDNEGHVIRYDANVEGKKAVFLSDAVEGQPRFKLTYDWSNDKALGISFEIQPPGGAFKPYLSGTAHKVTVKR